MKNKSFKFGCAAILVVGALLTGFIIVVASNVARSDKTSQTTGMPGSDGNLTLAQYEQLQAGMSEEQVADILGTTGKEQSSSSVSMGATSTTSSARIYDGKFMQAISVIYSDGKLMSKSQIGLQ